MKSINFKISFFGAVYFVMAFIAVIIYTLQQSAPAELLQQFTAKYMFLLILENFLRLLPVLFLTTILVAYSWNYAKYQDEKDSYTKLSVVMTDLLKRVFVVVLVSLVSILLALELIMPILEINRQSILNSSRNYKEFRELVAKSLDKKDYVNANLYANQVLRILPDSAEAKAIVADVEKKIKNADVIVAKQKETEKGFVVENAEVPQLIEMAQKSFDKKSYFDAHYYSTLALQAFNPKNANLDDAKRLASESWNMLQSFEDAAGSLTKDIYQRKRNGYDAFISGDYFEAYYIFRQLHNEIGDDPDIKRYMNLAQENLEKQYFFMDETLDLKPFEYANDVYFSIKTFENERWIVGIKGISAVENAGRVVQYMRGMHIIVYGPDGKIKQNYYVPYAKASEQKADYFEPKYQVPVEKEKVKTLPFIILKSVDRENKNIAVAPVNNLNGEKIEMTSVVLPLPYRDLLQIIDTAPGPDNMALNSLIAFCGKAEKYGFAKQSFIDALCNRLCFPLLFLIIAMISAICAWKYKISAQQMVHFWWLLLVPLFSVLYYFVLELGKFLQKMVLYILSASIGVYAVCILAVVYLCIFVILCMRYTKLKEY